MIRTSVAFLVLACIAHDVQAGEDPPCLEAKDVCHILPPQDPNPCGPHKVLCYFLCHGEPCCRCVPGTECGPVIEVCQKDNKSCEDFGDPPINPCTNVAHTCLSSSPLDCWICTTVVSSCPYPPKVGSVITFGMDTLATCSDENHSWTICDGQGLVQVLDPTSPPNATDTLRVRATGAGSITVRGRVDGPGCWGPYQIAKTVTIAASCIPDITGDNTVDVQDMLEVMNNWGNPGCGGASCCPADLDLDGDVDNADLAIVTNGWGACP